MNKYTQQIGQPRKNDKFLETYNLQRQRQRHFLFHDEIENVNRLITSRSLNQ